jgi:hypothetical protein
MRLAPLIALSVAVFASGSVLAQESLGAIEVRAEASDRVITISCTDAQQPSLKDVENVLAISDPSQSPKLRDKLMGVAKEACAQKVPKILVSRGANGALTWKPLQ